ncbi:hypothetical protein FQR65_LT08505 [Abscondita terminalis]|nr:hypothetical protein FQR65_LT08505 [Abscondita terminalis]
MSYAVVTFTKESNDSVETVSEVPISWLTEDRDFCKWPPSNAKIYINRNKPAADDWQLFPIRVEHICGSLLEARKKFRLWKPPVMKETEVEAAGSQDQQFILALTNSIKTQKMLQVKVVSSHRVHAPPYKKIQYQEDSVHNQLAPVTYVLEDDTTADDFTNQMISTFSSTKTVNKENETDNTVTPLVTPTTSSIISNLENNLNTNYDSEFKCLWCNDRFDKIIRALSEQNLILRELAQRIMDIAIPSKNETAHFIYKLPCENLQDIENLEKYLAEDTKQYDLFRDYIRKIGGNGGKDFVLRFMKFVFSNVAGELCSWTGAKTNFRLQNLKIMKAAYDTILEATGITQKHFETFIKEWLRNCK